MKTKIKEYVFAIKKTLQCATDKGCQQTDVFPKENITCPIYLFTEKLCPWQGYRLVASGIFEVIFLGYTWREGSTLKINKYYLLYLYFKFLLVCQ